MDRAWTVRDVARLSGVSVRALHHYDRIGLLTPARVERNGYRLYGREDLLRLQQILFYRELEFPLEAIAAVLAAPDFDRVEALKAHRSKLETRSRRYQRLLATLDETLLALNGDREMDAENLYEGFDPEKQAEHEAWLIKRYGGDMPRLIEDAKARVASGGKAGHQAMQAEADAINADLAKAMADALPADSAAAQALVARHYAWVCRSWTPDAVAYAGLGDLYLEHEDFRAAYDKVAPGLAEYLAAAMKSFAANGLKAARR